MSGTADLKYSYSIVLMTYNQADYVADAVRGLLAQDCAPVEILISDDCSTDDTFGIVQDTVRGYEGPHHIVLNRNPKNLGVNRHIKKCYDLSSGDVIIATSGDDICYPNRAARTIEVFETQAPLLAFSQARVETFDGQEMPRNYRKATLYSRQDALSAAVSMQLYLGATCAWHKDLFRKYGPIAYDDCYEDLIFGFRAALEKRISFIDEDLVRYRLGTGLTSSASRYTSPEDYQAKRARDIQREISVLRQRRDDGRLFGLRADDPIMRTIERRLADRELRHTSVTGGVKALCHVGWRRPLGILDTLVSERRRHRVARRNT